MFIRWNNTSKAWSNSMGGSLNKEYLVGLDKNFRTTLLINRADGENAMTLDVLVVMTNNVPMFLDAKDLSVVDMNVVERSSIAHPILIPVLCSPAYQETHQKLSRDMFMSHVLRRASQFALEQVLIDKPWTEETWDTTDTLSVSFNELHLLNQSGLIFVSDGSGEKGKRYFYVETCQYDYLFKPRNDYREHDDGIWVRYHVDGDTAKETWTTWGSAPWATVSEDVNDLISVIENNF